MWSISWWTMRDRLLVRHFLLRFLDHDLISPHADRREVLTITCAMLIVSSLFLAFFLAVKYQFNLFLPPGLTSILALDDRFFLISIAMIAMALLAVAEWDALALDARDAAVLGPLPVPTAMIVRAKFVAIMLFAAAFDVGLSLGPTALRVVALPVRLPVTMTGALRLAGTHALCATAAGGFGFVAVLGVHESCRAAVGAVRFRRISAAIQATLVVLLLTALLLLPGTYSRVALQWLTHARVPPVAIPPLWFVGLHEILAGGVIDQLPRGAPPARFAAAERDATALYRSLWPQFHELATVAIIASILVVLATSAACAWNHRRLPSDAVTRDDRFGVMKRFSVWLATRVIVGSPGAKAGFFFAMQALARSAPHRVTVAASVAVAFSIAVITIGAFDLRRTFTPASIPTSVYALQTLMMGALLTGFRHLVRIPAELRANWAFQLAWSGNERQYLAGVKRTALVALVAPTVVLLLVFDVFVFGARFSVVHATAGVCVGVLFVELLFITYRQLPFAMAYVGSGDLKSAGLLFAAGALIATVILAESERAALTSLSGELAFFGALVALIAGIRTVDAARRQAPLLIDFDELPSGATQRFELTH